MIRDLTKGKPLSNILSFCVSILLGNLFQQFYNMADSVIVGKFVGVQAFAGIGATAALNFFVIGFALGLCSGCGIPIAQAFGANRHAEMRRYLAHSLYLVGLAGLLLTLLMIFFTGPLLRICKTPEDIFEDAYSYIYIIFCGIGTTLLYNMGAAVLRAVGNSRTPLAFLIFSCVLNVALDYLFVAVFRMGVSGAAYATVLAQGISGLLCLLVIYRSYPLLHLQKEDGRLSARAFGRVAGIGVPMGLQFSITAIGSLILQTAVNSLGSDAVAAIAAANKVHNIVTAPLDSVGATMATYVGQNYGAGQYQRIRRGVLQITAVCAAYCVVALFINVCFGVSISKLFLESADTNLFENIYTFLYYNALFYFPLAIIFIYRNSLQGLGHSKLAMAAGLAELIGRCIVAFICVPTWGYRGACMANPFAWIAADLLLLPMFFYELGQMKRQ